MSQLETDICVIGSGVAGAIVARECLDAGRKVIMLEAGARTNGRSLFLQFAERIIRDYRIPRMSLWHRKSRYKNADFQSTGNKKYSLSNLAVVARGGSTLGWSGDAYRLKPEDFRLRSVTGHGLDWPISYDVLEPYYILGEKSLGVAGDHLDSGHPPRSTAFPLKPRPYSARDEPYLDLLSNQGWASMHHNISLSSDGGVFTADELLNHFEKEKDLRLFTRCVATRILCSSKNKATAVECWDARQGESFTINAVTVVVCAGGIETPNLLRRSANEWWPDGLGNHSGHLGRHLITHPGFAYGGRPRGLRLIDGPIGPTAATRHFDTETEQGLGKYILLWRPAPSGYLFLNACIEQFPNGDNAVMMGSVKTKFGTPRPIINYNYDEQLKERLRTLAKHFESLAAQINLTISNRRSYIHAHPMGTSRMAANPGDGVIDADLRIHGMDNVYVCGSACFPSGGAANPTVTIAALAHRLGAHLTNKP